MIYAWLLVVVVNIGQDYSLTTVSDIGSEKACHDLAHRMGYKREAYDGGNWFNRDDGDHHCYRYESAKK